MKEEMDNVFQLTVCPKCGKPYRGAPTISRDSTQLICPDCGTREALERGSNLLVGDGGIPGLTIAMEGLGLSQEEQDHILGNIHRYQEEQE